MKLRIFIFVLAVISFKLYAQPITVDATTYTPQQLVQNVLTSGCLSAQNVVFTGSAAAIGYFDATGTPFDTIFTSGIIFASGNATNAIGPNSSGGISTGLGVPGDTDLDALIPQSTQDASVIEFDFVPSADTLEFRYVFGSDEYPEYVNSSFNDVFAFFLSGPNPAGGSYTNENIAIIPGTTTAVSINNVNNGSNSPPTGPCTNCEYYFDNLNVTNAAIEYDGYTVALTATAIVTPCQTYHIKLAVADAGDSALDSGVFLEAGSFSSGSSVSIQNVSNVGTLNDMYEGCTNFYIFSRNDSLSIADPVMILLQYAGTATMGSDITMFPDTFWIPSGQMSDTIFYDAFNDGIQEPVETFIIEILAGCPCNPSTSADTITIYDFTEFKAGIANTDSMFCGITAPSSYTIQAECVSHPSWFVTFLWNTGETTTDITVTPPPTGTSDVYWVEVSDLCGNSIIDSITIGVSTLSGIDISSQDALCYNACNGQVEVTALGATQQVTYLWSEPTINSPYSGLVYTLCADSYSVTITDASQCSFVGYFAIDHPLIALDPNSGITNTNTVFCENPGTITLETSTNLSDVNYLWSSGNTTPTISFPASLGNSVFWVDISDFCGLTYRDSIVVGVSDFQGLVLSTDTVSCYGSCDGSVNVLGLAGISPFQYNWPTGIGNPNSGNILDLCTGFYGVTVTDDVGCSYDTTFNITGPEDFSLCGISTNYEFCGTSAPPSLILETYVNTGLVTYLWNTGDNGSSIAIVPQSGDVYWVQITDICGNIITDTARIAISDFSGMNLSYADVLCYATCTGQVDATPQNGTPPFRFTWYPSNIGTQTSGVITDLCPGNYMVTIIDDLGCNFDSTFIIGEPDELLISLNAINASSTACTGAATAIVDGGVPPYSYLWNDAQNQTTYNAQDLCAGTYTVSVKDANECIIIDSVEISGFVAISEISNQNQVLIYPNPNHNGNFYIEFDNPFSNYSLKIFDITGKEIRFKYSLNKNIVKIENIPVGINLLQITINNNEIVRKKLVVLK
ncbi:MAG: T9SS type A sorting domain-containing protein [Bacteroidetes bacterium]|nr:T9SS type A sorting domain-containing protein [Bacteroidota bacterium]MBT6688035.1 T9SS type A sorting domain-containing protein [Bacteroidota bacterium]MBT7144801.1 T9SS type A sorting domain-containing protein [Bacteroidota bacterium]MBT7492392.1 T9SS type A sorting domain-containing protein [Bacteroidota bacterium]